MKKKFILSLMTFLIISVRGFAVTVQETTNLIIYYPDYSEIDFVCGQMPNAAQKDVEFCCEAAFTGELLNTFKHTNIADNHICNGVMKKGYRCRANTGGFVWNKKGWRFMKKADYPTAAESWKMGFCQILLIKDGKMLQIWSKIRNSKNIFRALCEKDGRLCIIQSRKIMTCDFFVKSLCTIKVTNALYLDMGKGWNYAWYRDNNDKVIELFPESKKASSYRYRTNWITFYK